MMRIKTISGPKGIYTKPRFSVKAYQSTVRDYVSSMRDEEFSYAGGLFGIVSNDAVKSISETDVKDYTPDHKNLKVIGSSDIQGGIVGGVIGCWSTFHP